MKIRHVSWINHEKNTLYSLDANPVFPKIATSGPIGTSGLVRIWNIESLRDKLPDSQKSILLASIEFSTNVNMVRWSPNGKLFACASDDKQVTIWEYNGRVESAGTIGQHVGNVELYRCLHHLAYHTMEVNAVEWSPCGKFLASGSMDNRVVIWNAQSFPDRVAVLDAKNGGHTNSVQGICWDPIGTFFCSQSTDKTLKVWRCEQWQVETTISEPFEESFFSSLFFRPNWSPDGQYLFCPMAKNTNIPVCKLVTRGTWNAERDFIGHRKSVLVVKSCHRLVEYKDHKGQERKVSVIAVGSADFALSVWAIPFFLRPLLVIQRLFEDSIVDLTWSGLELFVASRDGTVFHLPFSDQDLGRLLTIQEMAEECQKLYQMCPPIYRKLSNGYTNGLLINGSTRSVDDQLSPFKAPKTISRNDSSQKSEEEKNPEDRTTKTSALQTERSSQIEVKDDKGRRRIQPKFIASIMTTEAAPQPSTSMIPTQSINKKDFTLPTKRPAETVVSPEKDARPSHKKRRAYLSSSSESENDEEDTEMSPIDRNDPQTSTTKEAVLAADFKRPQLRILEPLSVSQGTLAVPELKKSLAINLLGNAGTLEVENEWKVGSGVGRATKVQFITDGDIKWSLITTSAVLVAAANKYWCITGSAERYIQLIDASCGRLVITLVLNGIPVRVGVQLHFAFALTSTGHFYSWNLQEKKMIINGVSVSDMIVSEDSTISSVNLSNIGVPLISFSSGNIFTYSLDFARWVLLDRGTTCLSRCFDGLQATEMNQGYLSKALRKRIKTDIAPLVGSAIRSICKESQLEEWLAGSRAAGSWQDVQSLVKVYARFLIEHNNEPKLRALLKEFGGTVPQEAAILKSIENLIRSNKDLVHLVNPPEDMPMIF